MSTYLLLTRTLLKCGMGGGSGSSTRGGNGMMSLALSFVVMIPIVGSLVTAVTASCSADIAAGGTGYLIVEQALAMGMAVAFVLGTTMVISTFYTSGDVGTLMALPLPASVVAGAKWTICLLFDYSLVLWAAAPALIGYGIASGASIPYWVFALVVGLLLPATPLSYGGVLVMLLMRAFRRIRNKQLLTILGFVLTGILVCAMFYASFTMQQGDAAGMTRSYALFGKLAFLFPNLVFANDALAHLSPASLSLFAASVVAEVAVFLLVARLVYFKSVVGMSEATSRHAALTGKEMGGATRQQGALASFVRVERTRVMRSPTCVAQGVLVSLVWPVIAIMTIVTAGSYSPGTDIMGSLAAASTGDETPLVLVLIGLGLSVFTTSSNKMSGSAISREGSGLSLLKTFPLGYRDIVRWKVRSNVLPSFVLGSAVPLAGAVFCTVNGMSPLIIVAVAAVGLLSTIAINYLQILFDLRAPELVWTDETQPLRQMSLLISNFAGLGVGVALVAAGMGLGFFLMLDTWMTIACLVALTAVVAFAFRAAALRYGERRLAELS